MQSIKNERMAKSFLSPESSISVNIYFFHCVLTHSNKFINAILKRSFQFTQKKKKKNTKLRYVAYIYVLWMYGCLLFCLLFLPLFSQKTIWDNGNPNMIFRVCTAFPEFSSLIRTKVLFSLSIVFVPFPARSCFQLFSVAMSKFGCGVYNDVRVLSPQNLQRAVGNLQEQLVDFFLSLIDQTRYTYILAEQSPYVCVDVCTMLIYCTMFLPSALLPPHSFPFFS